MARGLRSLRSVAVLSVTVTLMVVGLVVLSRRKAVAPAELSGGEPSADEGDDALLARVQRLSQEMKSLQGRAQALIERPPSQQAALDQARARLDSLAAVNGQSVNQGAAAGGRASSAAARFRADGHCGPRFPAPLAPDFGECDPLADADQKGPCCNPESGWCGNVRDADWGHCDCPTCRDFSKDDAAVQTARFNRALSVDAGGKEPAMVHHEGGQLEQRAVAAAMPPAAAPAKRIEAPPPPQAAVPAKASLARFRSDGRCGPNFPAPGAPLFGECDPKVDADQKGPCCNPESGWCGNIRQVDWGHCDCPTCVDYSGGSLVPMSGRVQAFQSQQPSFCDTSFASNDVGWKSAEGICTPLFSSADFGNRKDSKVECRIGRTIPRTTCLGLNLVLGAMSGAGGGFPTLHGACLFGRTQGQIQQSYDGPPQAMLNSMVLHQEKQIDLASMCQNWEDQPTILVAPTENVIGDLHAAYQSAQVFDIEPSIAHIVFSTPPAASALDAWQAVFGSTAEISDKPAGTCFAKVAVAYDGQRSPLVTDAAFLDCTADGLRPCRDFQARIPGQAIQCPTAKELQVNPVQS